MRLFATLAALASLVCLIEAQVTITFDTYLATISVNNAVWLQTGDIWFNARGTRYSTADQTLNLTSTHTAPGIDTLGRYVATTHSWASLPAGLTWETAYRVYSNEEQSSITHIVFRQTWLTGDDATTVKDVDSVLSSFPTFIPDKSSRSLGANQWVEAFDSSKAFVWSGAGASLKLARGRAAGPLVLFDAKEPNLVSVFSNFNEFMATSFVALNGQLSTGIVGSMTSVPAQFTCESILSFSERGVNEGVLQWGDLMLMRYGKNRLAAFNQPNTQYLGYNTDNGAYYYYHTEQGMNYEQTLEAVIDYARQSNIPYRGMLLDSWWYPKDKNGAVTSWTPMPSVFPSGLTALAEYLKMPFIAHNRYWSPDSPYATQNGGVYDWHVDGQWSMPTEQRFWDDLIANNTVWGLRVYEQDWLFTVFDNMAILQTNITFGRSWLHQMGSGASRSGVDIQYCMPYPRYVLQSVEIPNVVQVRASGDNTPGNVGNAEIGESNLLSYALGIASFKDGFWTVSVEEGNPYNGTEPSPGLHAVVATLSLGPVYPSDKIGLTNITLLARSHRADGLILKPDRPALALDVSYYHRAFGTNGPDAAQITLAQSTHARWNWNVLLVLEESHDYTLTTGDLGIAQSDTQSYIAYSWHAGDLHYDFVSFDNKNPLPLSANPHVNDFTVWYLAPVLVPGFALLGETSKWVPMSKQRVNGFQISQQSVTLNLIGEVWEKVTIDWARLTNVESGNLYDGGFAQSWVAHSADCVLNNAGSATLTIALDGSNSFTCVQ